MNIRRFILALLFFFVSLAGGTTNCQAQSSAQDVRAGRAALERDDFKGAAARFERAIRASASNPRVLAIAYHGRGAARLQLHEWSAAKDDLSRAIALDPKDAGAFAARGMARKGLGDYDGLLLDAHQAAALNPTNFSSFEDDAKSTVLYRRMMLVFLVLAGILLVVGAIPLVRTLVRLIKAGV